MSRVALAIVVMLVLAGCILSAKQRRAPLHSYSDRGTPAQEAMTGKFLLDVTAT